LVFTQKICTETFAQCSVVHPFVRYIKLVTTIGLARFEFRDVIIRCGLVGNCLPACFAHMDDQPAFLSVIVQMFGGHKAVTRRCPVAGSCAVHVFRIQALRAMIAVAAVFKRRHVEAAMFADESFLAGDEGHLNAD
jgi:hypothetical protein